MRRFVIACCFLSEFIPISTLSNTSEDLQFRLAKVNSFHAFFLQTLTSSKNGIFHHGAGEFWIKRPNLFHWHITSPDESLFISDGQTLWFYDPFIEQVIATWLKDATEKTPFMLIASNNANDWNKYRIKQRGDNFQLIPKSKIGNLKQFTITVSPIGNIRSFSFVELDGQSSTYVLKKQQIDSGDNTKFIFTPPRGVTLDDQRQ